MKCSECGHPISKHYPNFKGGLPITFYCGHKGFGGCSCVRPAADIEYRQEGATFIAESEARR